VAEQPKSTKKQKDKIEKQKTVPSSMEEEGKLKTQSQSEPMALLTDGNSSCRISPHLPHALNPVWDLMRQ
jgi:hypothetical protein